MKSVHIELRSKIIVTLVFYIGGLLSMGYVSYDDLRATEKKIEVLELAYQLNNILLEARRHEKNFLLYNTEESLQENSRYLQQAHETGLAIKAQAERMKVEPMLQQLESCITLYREAMESLARHNDLHDSKYERLVASSRDFGKEMTELSKNIAEFERVQIGSMIMVLKEQIIFWASMAMLLGVVLTLLIIHYIFRPLSVIKKATEDIAKGRYREIEVISTHDEMEQVMEAFNTMVHELERRQDQLVQSEKLSSIGTLTAGVAHQLNNPLNNISTSCQIAMDEIAEGDREFLGRMLKNIYQETLRARDVVKGLLEFSRVQEFALRPIPMQEVVQKSIRLVQSQLPSDISLTAQVPDDLVVPMDSQKMQEVFVNLFINAIQSIEGGGHIEVHAEKDELNNQAIIRVEDSGPGIPENIQGQLFDPFYTTKEEGKGTGLGLSIVYGIIKKHEGSISVKSSPGQGASFIIALPLATGETK